MDLHTITEQERVRRQKLVTLYERGIDPYPARCERTHTTKQAKAAFERGELGPDDMVALVGRIMTRRVMGKASFAHIEDGSGRIQIHLRLDRLGEETYNWFFKKMLDIGDIIGVKGPIFRTRTGEITCEVRELTLLAKTLHPLPDKWHGLTDVETRYRHRYVDLMVNPDVREIFIKRARLVRAIRDYLDSEGFIEVETPILQPIYGGAAARPFVTYHNELDQELYLRISFELYLKRLIVGGYERVYEIGRDFRNEGVSFKHNPEFTQLEFYEAYTDYHGVMRRAEELITYAVEQVNGSLCLTYQGHEIDLTPPWPRVPLADIIKERTGIDIFQYRDPDALRRAIQDIGGNPNPQAGWGKLVDSLLSSYVEETLIQPTFIIDYPVDISPLAKRSPDNPEIVERFEGFIGGMEICNAFSELNDPLDQLERFLEQGRALEAGDEEAHPVDEDFILALRFGMPPTGGFGMGIDRLTMIVTDKPSIREVILFPHLRTQLRGLSHPASKVSVVEEQEQ